MNSTLFVCVTCRGDGDVARPQEVRPGVRLLAALEGQHAAAAGMDLEIVGVECLSNCQRSCTAAVTAPGKWTYVIGNLDPDRHAADILDFARQHGAHTEGLPVWRERPEHVRKNTVARIPPMPTSTELK